MDWWVDRQISTPAESKAVREAIHSKGESVFMEQSDNRPLVDITNWKQKSCISPTIWLGGIRIMLLCCAGVKHPDFDKYGVTLKVGRPPPSTQWTDESLVQPPGPYRLPTVVLQGLYPERSATPVSEEDGDSGRGPTVADSRGVFETQGITAVVRMRISGVGVRDHPIIPMAGRFLCYNARHFVGIR